MKKLGALILVALIALSGFIFACLDGELSCDASDPAGKTMMFCQGGAYVPWMMCAGGYKCQENTPGVASCVPSATLISCTSGSVTTTNGTPQYPTDISTSDMDIFCHNDCPNGGACDVGIDGSGNPTCACAPPPACVAGNMQCDPTDLTNMTLMACQNGAYVPTLTCAPGFKCVNTGATSAACSASATIISCNSKSVITTTGTPNSNDISTSDPAAYCRNDCPNGGACDVGMDSSGNPTCACAPNACSAGDMQCDPADPTSMNLMACQNGAYVPFMTCAPGFKCVNTGATSAACSASATIISCNSKSVITTTGTPNSNDISTSDPAAYCRNDCPNGQSCDVGMDSSGNPTCACSGITNPLIIVSCSSGGIIDPAASQTMPGDLATSDPALFCRNDCSAGEQCIVSGQSCLCQSQPANNTGTTTGTVGGYGGGSGLTGSGGGSLPEKKQCTNWGSPTVKEKKVVTEKDEAAGKKRDCTYTTYVKYCLTGDLTDMSIKDEYTEMECADWTGLAAPEQDCQYIYANTLLQPETSGDNCRECKTRVSVLTCPDGKTYPEKTKTTKDCTAWASCQKNATAVTAKEENGLDIGSLIVPIIIILALGLAFAYLVLGKKDEDEEMPPSGQ